MNNLNHILRVSSDDGEMIPMRLRHHGWCCWWSWTPGQMLYQRWAPEHHTAVGHVEHGYDPCSAASPAAGRWDGHGRRCSRVDSDWHFRRCRRRLGHQHPPDLHQQLGASPAAAAGAVGKSRARTTWPPPGNTWSRPTGSRSAFAAGGGRGTVTSRRRLACWYTVRRQRSRRAGDWENPRWQRCRPGGRPVQPPSRAAVDRATNSSCPCWDSVDDRRLTTVDFLHQQHDTPSLSRSH